MTTTELPDAAARRDAVRERDRNVLVDAGAGTGKTTLILDRVVDMIAPHRPGVEPRKLDRLAVITFTRRAAGELRYRLRQKLLVALRDAAGARADLLREALGAVDTAWVGTIHGFADRLLRLRPVEARISPSYEIAEDTEELVHATFDRLMHAGERGRLAEALGGRTAGRVDLAEIEQTVRLVHEAGLRIESEEREWGTLAGIDSLVDGMIANRDVDYLPDIAEPDRARLRAIAGEAAAALGGVTAPTRGGRFLGRVARALAEASRQETLEGLFLGVHEVLGREPNLKKGRDFEGDRDSWKAYKRLCDEWRPALCDPLQAWLGSRIARLRDVVVALYEREKADRSVLDQLDLLEKLRDVLRHRPEVRRDFQALFDHVFVDEFQDTDPLQCEIVFYLCEDGADARDWRDVRLRPGSLTVVGDPKQSIYRFRRADIAMYAAAHESMARQGALPVPLVTNFRSRPGLIDFVNTQFGRLLGDEGERFEPGTGRVRYERLAAAPAIAAAGPAVHVVPFASGAKADEARAVEAEAMARRIRWLVRSGLPVRDPETRVERRLRYGDIAVLAHVTVNVPLLLRAFEALDIRYAASGGRLFLSDPLARRYLLGLRAVADRSDGVAMAALLQPPFFALDWIDLLAEDVGADRTRIDEARALVRELRRDRLLRPPIETAVDLIERTALGRVAATGPNGRQALDALYELAFQVGRRAAERGLDYDGVTRELRQWVKRPVQLDPPHAGDADTVRVLTIHQAKGLEFPVVVVWDAAAEYAGRTDGCWRVARTGDGLALAMQGLSAELPPGSGLLAHEKDHATHERERLYYVAMTRARDLLVVPEAPRGKGKRMLPEVLRGAAEERAERYAADARPAWAEGDEPRRDVVGDAAVAARIDGAQRRFTESLAVASAPVAVPTAITRAARAAVPSEEEGEAAAERAGKAERSRHGRLFGTTVHRALELALTGARGTAAEIVARAAREQGLAVHLDEAVADVERALAAVQALGATAMHAEYPVSMLTADGTLLVGFIDLLAESETGVAVIDFKTDAAPAAGATAAAYPEYRRQLETYVEALRHADLVGTRRVRAGLLFTETGQVAWA